MQIERKGDTLTITVNVSDKAVASGRPSSSAKTVLVDTAGQMLGDLKVQCSIYVRPDVHAAYVARQATPAKAAA